MVIRYDETLTHYSEKAPSNFISTILERSECPVVVVPPVHKPIEKVIFLYDGEASSTFAIRQFNYVLPGMVDIKTELLSIKSKKLDASLPDGFYMREWLKLNFENVPYKVITGDTEDEIVGYLSEQVSNCLVVLGAYNRSSISRMIHKSLADTIITTVNCPLFISHR
jgi:nucleotide-binding universal stress UspA family protein